MICYNNFEDLQMRKLSCLRRREGRTPQLIPEIDVRKPAEWLPPARGGAATGHLL